MRVPGRLLTAMVTPFDEAGAVDYEQAKRLALALVDSGSDGMVVSGTTGESPTLANEEKLRLFAAAKAAVGERAMIIAGTGNYNTAESIELTREAEAIGVDGILLVVPYYNRPGQEGLYQHFKAIAGATSLPVILYNVPSRTVANLAAETVTRLAQIDNIIGVKEASSNLEQIARIIDGAPDGFHVWSGNDGDTLPILALGGYGVVSVASHLVGLQIKAMIEAFVAGHTVEAAAMHRKLLPISTVIFVTANPQPIRWALNRVGFNVGQPRLPLVDLDAASAAQVEAVLKTYQIDLPLPQPAR